MKNHSHNLTAAALLVACIASSVGCYPAYPPPNGGTAYNQDAKGYSVPQDPVPQGQPTRYAVDPGLVVAGAAAAGLLGYAIGSNHGHHYGGYYGPRYYGPRYYAPAPYYGRGYYGRGGYYRPRHYH